MIIDLRGRRSVVTGSTAGIGRAIAEGLARASGAVVITGRGRERAVKEMSCAFPGGDISGQVPDLATRDGAEAVFGRAPDADILVNNLGTAIRRPFGDITDADWLDIFQTNVMSGVRISSPPLFRPAVDETCGRLLVPSAERSVCLWC